MTVNCIVDITPTAPSGILSYHHIAFLFWEEWTRNWQTCVYILIHKFCISEVRGTREEESCTALFGNAKQCNTLKVNFVRLYIQSTNQREWRVFCDTKETKIIIIYCRSRLVGSTPAS